MGKKKLLLGIGLALVLAVVGLAGCALTTAATDGLEDITWILESYGEQGDLQAVLEGTEITAIFDSAEGQVTGSAGCNSYFARYEASGNELSILELAWTEMGCLEPQGILEQETQYLQALQSAESYKIEDGKLQITSGNQVLIFRDSEEPPVSHGGPTTDYVSLIDNLRAAGATVEPAGEVSQPFFSVTGNIIVVNGGDVQVFEYADAAAAEAEAALVSPDGSSVGTSMVSWVATPHFYKAGRLIVLYVGDSTGVINVLEAELGQQFAGYGTISLDGQKEMEIRLAPIHEVEVRVPESSPSPIFIYIKGGLADACTSFHELKTERSGNIINITVTTERPKDAICAQVYGFFEKNVELGDDFAWRNSYTVNVNGVTTSFDYPS